MKKNTLKTYQLTQKTLKTHFCDKYLAFYSGFQRVMVKTNTFHLGRVFKPMKQRLTTENAAVTPIK